MALMEPLVHAILLGAARNTKLPEGDEHKPTVQYSQVHTKSIHISAIPTFKPCAAMKATYRERALGLTFQLTCNIMLPL